MRIFENYREKIEKVLRDGGYGLSSDDIRGVTGETRVAEVLGGPMHLLPFCRDLGIVVQEFISGGGLTSGGRQVIEDIGREYDDVKKTEMLANAQGVNDLYEMLDFEEIARVLEYQEKPVGEVV